MNLFEALLMSLLGITLIMAALAFFMVLIKFTSFLIRLYEAHKKKTEEAKVKPSYADGTCGTLTLIDTTEREAALIMAITADKMQIPINRLRFISIKKIGEDNK